MTTVRIIPLHRWARKVPWRLRPIIPPIFPDEFPTEADKDLAYELFLALDPESQEWYRRHSVTLRAMEQSKNSKRQNRYKK